MFSLCFTLLMICINLKPKKVSNLSKNNEKQAKKIDSSKKALQKKIILFE